MSAPAVLPGRIHVEVALGTSAAATYDQWSQYDRSGQYDAAGDGALPWADLGCDILSLTLRRPAQVTPVYGLVPLAADLTAEILDWSGALDPHRTDGPWGVRVRRGVPVRVTVDPDGTDAERIVLMTGVVTAWLYTPNAGITVLQATDALPTIARLDVSNWTRPVESAADRVAAAASVLPARHRPPLDITPGGPQISDIPYTGSLWDHMVQCTDAAGGVLDITRAGHLRWAPGEYQPGTDTAPDLTLSCHTRPAALLYAGGEIVHIVDSATLATVVEAGRPLADGTMSTVTLTDTDGYAQDGPVVDRPTYPLTSDADLAAAARRHLDRTAVTRPTLGPVQVTVSPHTGDTPQILADQLRTVAEIERWHVADVLDHAGDRTRLLVAGIEHRPTITDDGLWGWTTTLSWAPPTHTDQDAYDLAVYDTAAYL